MTSTTAALSPNESNWGGRGGCLGLLVYLFCGSDSPLVVVEKVKWMGRGEGLPKSGSRLAIPILEQVESQPE